MSAALAIAARELRAHRHVLLGALTIGLLLLTLRTPAWRGLGLPADPSSIIVPLIGGLLAAGVAVALGATMFVSDLVEHRLAFYLARPVPVLALWAGKQAAAIVVVLLTGLFVMGPDVAVSGEIPLTSIGQTLIFISTLILMISASHALASMLRSRSPLVVLDLLLLMALAAAFFVTRVFLGRAGADQAITAVLPVLFVAGAVATMVAAAVQLAYGRTDVRRGHTALSITVWTLAALVAGSFHLWARWVLAVTPAETRAAAFAVETGPRGDLVLFGGTGPGRFGYTPFFAMDAPSGAYIRLGGYLHRWAFSPNGELAFGVPASRQTPYGARVMRARPGAAPVLEEIAIADFDGMAGSRLLAVSDAGAAVLAGPSSVTVYDLGTRKRVAETVVRDVMAAEFIGNGVRLFTQSPVAVTILDWTPGGGAPIERVRIAENRLFLVAAAGDTALISVGYFDRTLVHIPTGALRRLRSGEPYRSGSGLILSDGRAAFARPREIEIVDQGETPIVSVPLPEGTHATFMTESAPGELAIGLWSVRLDERRTMLLDAATGAVLQEVRGLTPVLHRQIPGIGGAEPGSLGSRLYNDEDGALVELRPDGTRRVLVPAAVKQ